MSDRARIDAIVIGLVVWMAACGASGDSNSSSTAPTPPAVTSTFAFGPSVVIGASETQFRGGEPTLRTGGSGTLWSTNTGPSQIWKSTDRGSTWTFVKPPLTLGGGDMDGLEDSAGRLHVVDLMDGTGGCLFYYRSSDGGRTFDIVRASRGGGVWVDGDGGCANERARNVDRPWILTFGDRTLYIIYRNSAAGGGQNGTPGAIDISVDAGQTFSHVATGDFPTPDGNAIDLADGTVYLAGYEVGVFDPVNQRSLGRTVRVARLEGGRMVSSVVAYNGDSFDTGAGGFPSMAVDADHNVYVAWADNSAGTVDTYLSASRDRGVTWSPKVRLSHDQTVVAYPTIVAGAGGHVGVAWFGTSDPAKARNDAAGASWFVYAAQSIDAQSMSPTFSVVKVSDEAFHHGSLCYHLYSCEGVPLQLPSTYEPGVADFFRTAIDANGSQVVIWTDTAHGPPKDHVARQIGGPLLDSPSNAPALTQKIQRMNAVAVGHADASQSTTLTESELNVYVHQWARARQALPLVDPTVTLTGSDRFTLHAFVADRSARLSPIAIDGMISAGGGTATLDLTAARVNGVSVDQERRDRLFETVFDRAWVGFDVRSRFALPARMRGIRIVDGQLVIEQ